MTAEYPCFAPTATSDLKFLANGFEPRRPIFTRDNVLVQIMTTNGPGHSPVIGLIMTDQDLTTGRVNPGYLGHPAYRCCGQLHRWSYEGMSYNLRVDTPRRFDLVPNVVRAFSFDRPFKARNGDTVTIISSCRRGERPYVGLVYDARSSDKVVLYYPNGKVSKGNRDTEWDLVNYDI